MKLIHCADLHLGANMLSVLPKQKAEERKIECKNTFLRLVDYAKKEGVKGILLCGDVFDSDLPSLADRSFFLSVVENTPEIIFFVLRGNHDQAKLIETKKYGNLKTFSDEFSSFEFLSVTIGGIENHDSQAFESISFPKEGKNILMLHGQIGDDIRLKELTGKNIDYLALGHLHSFRKDKLDERGEYAYSGCLEGRGFDECGEKGFVLLDVADDIQATFIPFASRTIHECFVDVTETTNAYEAYVKVKNEVCVLERDYYLIHLIGEVKTPFEKEREIASYLSTDCYYCNVKDETSLFFDVETLKGELSLKGEFIRKTLADESLSQEEKQQILRYGLMALSGKEVI